MKKWSEHMITRSTARILWSVGLNFILDGLLFLFMCVPLCIGFDKISYLRV